MVFYLAEAVLLAEHLHRRGLRHVHVHHANAASLVGLLAARLLDIGFSFTAHGSDILLEGDHFEEKIAESRFVITVSEFNRKRLVAAAGRVEPGRIRVVRTGVDLKRFRPCSARPGSGPKRLLTVGRLHPVKGFVHLIDALSRVREARSDFQLDVVGDGPLRADLEERIERAGLTEHVHLRGAIGPSDLPPFYAKADLFVLSSLSEGLPVVLMEAMASGLPVVATRITGVPELVRDGVSGILVPPAEPRPLAAAIRRLLADPLLAARLGRAGRRSVEREFDLEINVDRLDGLLRSELHELVESVERS
jgi:glycosyltransferase involved in cell wall biosynthesis